MAGPLLLLTLPLLTSLEQSLAQVPGRVPYPASGTFCSRPNTTYEESSGLCCSKCPPGYYKTSPCLEGRDTECTECSAGTYTEAVNTVPKCLSCRGPCNAEMGLMQFQNCTARSRRICVCVPGSYCKAGMDKTATSCSQCVTHTRCPPGQGVVIPGDFLRDTSCQECGNGTFSNVSSSTARCQEHTDCQRRGLETERAGNASSDARCQPARLGQEKAAGRMASDSTSMSLAALSSMLLLVVILTGYCVLRDMRQERAIRLPCLKWVFKTCIRVPEVETDSGNSPDEVWKGGLLNPVAQAQCDPRTEGTSRLPVQCEGLSSEDPRPAPGPAPSLLEGIGNVRREATAMIGSSSLPGNGGSKGSGIIGPVYIYNPSRVYVGVIGDSQRNSRRSLRGRADPAPANDDLEGGLRYPQEEQCPPSQWEPSRTPEQESGKESHLPESASD